MKLNRSQSRFLNRTFDIAVASVALALLTPSLWAQAPPSTSAQSQVMTTTTNTPAEESPKIPNDQLDSLVAPIALYPDPLLAQTLAASTYPLEVIQLQQWMDQNKNLKDKALADALAKQPWDPSVESMAGAPEALQRLAGNIQWTTDLGNAFLSQQSDVMDAIQRMRMKAENKGTLKTSSQQIVETRNEGGKEVVVIQPADPQVVYVPSYDPGVVYGPPAYPYYPYTYPGYYPGMGLAWGAAGFALGAWAGGYWGNCNWGGGDVHINHNNNFNRNNINNINRNGNRAGQLPANRGGGNGWQHNPSHRGNAPYGDRGTANRFGQGNRGGAGGRGGVGGPGGVGGVGGAGRPGGVGGVGGAGRPGGVGGAGGAGRPGGVGGAGGAGRPGGVGGAGGAGRPGGVGGAGGAGRPGGGASTRPSGGGGGNKVGNRSASTRPSSSRGGSFGGGSGNYARASSNRGGRSMGGGGYSRGGGGMSRGGGGMSRGGGGRGGGGRGGGGGRRR